MDTKEIAFLHSRAECEPRQTAELSQENVRIPAHAGLFEQARQMQADDHEHGGVGSIHALSEQNGRTRPIEDKGDSCAGQCMSDHAPEPIECLRREILFREVPIYAHRRENKGGEKERANLATVLADFACSPRINRPW
jgi:hypothetical protein